MELNKRKVKMVRCHYDPMLGPTPRNAFMLTDPNSPIEFAELTPVGIYFKMKSVKDQKADVPNKEHLVPFANIQSIELMPLEEKDEKPEKVILGQKVKG